MPRPKTVLGLVTALAVAACSDAGPAADGTWVPDPADPSSVTLRPELARDTLVPEPLPEWPSQPPFGDLVDVAADDAGRVVALDGLTTVAFVFRGEDGWLLERFGDAGVGPGEFRPGGIHSVLVQGDTALIPDRLSARVVLYRLDGTLLETVEVEDEGLLSPRWQRHPRGGFVYQTQGRTGAAPRLMRTRLGVEPGEPLMTLAVGDRSLEPGPLFPVPVWCVLPDGRVAWGWSDRYEVRISDPGGGDPGLVLDGPGEPAPLDAADREHLRELMRRSLASRGGGDPATLEAMVDRTPLPDVAPALAGLVCDDRGRVWARMPLDVASMGLSALRIGAPAGWGGPVWHVIDPAAGRVQVVRMPAGSTPTRIRGGTILGIRTDENDVETVGRWRLEG